jgi:lipopolysaccharide transport system permease protein
MKIYRTSPTELVGSIWRNRSLLKDMARRDAVGRYKGSLLGVAWAVLTPIIMLTIYTFVFVYVFKARWNNGGESNSQFAIILFAGLIVFNMFAEAISRSTSIILANSNFVKRVIFPLEILPCVTLLSAMFHACISVSILLAFEFFVSGQVPLTFVLLQIVVLPLLLMTIGLSWMIAAVGVYLRDLAQSIGLVVSALMFMSPIFFPSTAFPPRIKSLLDLNPLAFPIEQARRVLVWGTPVDWSGWLIQIVMSVVVLWAGFAVFQKLRKGFADVI